MALKFKLFVLAHIFTCLCVFTIASSTLAQSNVATLLKNESIINDLRNTISLWAGAWAAQIPDAYFGYYSQHYVASEFNSRETWMVDRRQRIENPEYIRIRLLDFELIEASELLVGEILATTRFTLVYERPDYSDRTYKELELIRRDGEWQITAERNLRVEVRGF